MQLVFADAGYWIALANPRDQLHKRATGLSSELSDYQMTTSELVLIEVLNGFADSGPHLRLKAAELAQAVLDDPNIDVVPQTPELFHDALDLYRERPDKSWSLTDCASFLIMERRQIVAALTYDRHFEQRGYRALLRRLIPTEQRVGGTPARLRGKYGPAGYQQCRCDGVIGRAMELTSPEDAAFTAH